MTELLSQAEVAALLGITNETLANHRCAGKGPRFVKLVGRVKYRKSDVEEFINSSVRQSTCKGKQQQLVAQLSFRPVDRVNNDSEEETNNA
jgi:hypothetical protein